VPIPTEQLETGDVIAFRARQGIIVTHRIIERTITDDGLFFTTKGDANPIADPQPVAAEDVIGQQRLTLPYLGYVIVWLRTLAGFAFGILLPATLIILHELRQSLAAWRALPKFRLPLRAPALGVASVVGLLIMIPFSHALLTTNEVSLLNITVGTASVFPTPTPTPLPSPTVEPTPTPSVEPSPTPPPAGGPPEGACDIEVNADFSNTNTGPGSTNKNSLGVDTDCTHTETNEATVENTFDIDVNTGGNTQNNNTVGGDVTSGSVTLDLNVTNHVNGH